MQDWDTEELIEKIDNGSFGELADKVKTSVIEAIRKEKVTGGILKDMADGGEEHLKKGLADMKVPKTMANIFAKKVIATFGKPQGNPNPVQTKIKVVIQDGDRTHKKDCDVDETVGQLIVWLRQETGNRQGDLGIYHRNTVQDNNKKVGDLADEKQNVLLISRFRSRGGS